MSAPNLPFPNPARPGRASTRERGGSFATGRVLVALALLAAVAWWFIPRPEPVPKEPVQACPCGAHSGDLRTISDEVRRARYERLLQLLCSGDESKYLQQLCETPLSRLASLPAGEMRLITCLQEQVGAVVVRGLLVAPPRYSASQALDFLSRCGGLAQADLEQVLSTVLGVARAPGVEQTRTAAAIMSQLLSGLTASPPPELSVPPTKAANSLNSAQEWLQTSTNALEAEKKRVEAKGATAAQDAHDVLSKAVAIARGVMSALEHFSNWSDKTTLEKLAAVIKGLKDLLQSVQPFVAATVAQWKVPLILVLTALAELFDIGIRLQRDGGRGSSGGKEKNTDPAGGGDASRDAHRAAANLDERAAVASGDEAKALHAQAKALRTGADSAVLDSADGKPEKPAVEQAVAKSIRDANEEGPNEEVALEWARQLVAGGTVESGKWRSGQGGTPLK